MCQANFAKVFADSSLVPFLMFARGHFSFSTSFTFVSSLPFFYSFFFSYTYIPSICTRMHTSFFFFLCHNRIQYARTRAREHLLFPYHVYKHARTHIHIRICIYMRIYEQTHMYAYVHRVSASTYTCIQCIYRHTFLSSFFRSTVEP